MCVLCVFDTVKEPIELGAPGAAVRLVQLLLKVISRLLPRGRIHLERPPQVLHIVHRLQLGNANSEHHHKESHQQVGVVVQRQVGVVAELLKTGGKREKTSLIKTFQMTHSSAALTPETPW